MADLMEYKCPCCGGAITFDSELQKMKCPYCDTEIEMEALQGFDEDLKADAPDEMNWQVDAGGEWSDGETDGMSVFVCKSCGGEIVADSNLAASSCPFCGNPIVLTGRFSGALKPDVVIPFKFNKKAAKEAYEKHISGKRLLPKVFKSQNHINEIKGVYVPFWLFDADADANIRYKATRVRHWSDTARDYTETSYYSVVRGGTLSFRAVPVDGSTKMADDLMESIEPFDMKDAVDFQTAYLAGYLADKYDVSAEDSIERANKRIKESTAREFEKTVTGFASCNVESSSIRLENGKTKYALCPVWLLNTTWDGKKYTFAMNGQTGKLVGDLPVDKAASRRTLLSIIGIGTAALLAIQYLIWLLF